MTAWIGRSIIWTGAGLSLEMQPNTTLKVTQSVTTLRQCERCTLLVMGSCQTDFVMCDFDMESICEEKSELS